MSEYKIPDEIKSRIPEYFYYALGGEYVSISVKSALMPDEDGFSMLDYCSSTAGYVEALRATCRKLNMDWLMEYWDSLEWFDSDVFDGEISDEVAKCFASESDSNPYYRYLLEQRKQ